MLVGPMMMSSGAKLHSLGGAAAPPELSGDLAHLAALPGPARRELWSALGPTLAEPLPPDLPALLQAFCRKHGVSGDGFARAVKASRFLLREAAAQNLEQALFAEDLAAVCGADATAVQGMLLPGYAIAKRQVQTEALAASAADHGKVLVSVDWRIDSVLASSRGAAEGPITMLTLRYRDGEKTERLTLQATPDVIAELKRLCAHAPG